MRLYDDVDPQLALPYGSEPIFANEHGESRLFPTGCIHVKMFNGDLTKYFVKVTNEHILKKVGLMMLQVRSRLDGAIPAGGRIPQPGRATEIRPGACAEPPRVGTTRSGYPRRRMVSPHPVRGLS